jgi:hypothetical protein
MGENVIAQMARAHARKLELVGAHRPNAEALAQKAARSQVQLTVHGAGDLPAKLVLSTPGGLRLTLSCTGCQEADKNGDNGSITATLNGQEESEMKVIDQMVAFLTKNPEKAIEWDLEGSERLYVEVKGEEKLSAFESASADMMV